MGDLPGARRALFSTQGLSQALFISSTDVTPDDQWFVFVGPVGITGRELIVVENWFKELKAKVGKADR